MNELNNEIKTAMEDAILAAAKAATRYYEKMEEKCSEGNMTADDARGFHDVAAAISRLMEAARYTTGWKLGELVTKE